ncbi:MAG: potassium/proton antiporter [Deltaproteobacteria bacterium]|nr:potassium/proton antiporter [Deltaproteobacteria bacterium]
MTHLTPEDVLLWGSLLLTLCVIASKASARFGIPTLILFVAVGMLAGSESFGGIPFDDPAAAQFIGVIALIAILFSGGLDTRFDVVRPAFGPGLTLATVGVLATMLLLGLGAWLVLPISPLEGILIGAVVASTDAAAVFGQLKAQRLELKGRVAATLEVESGTNDPLAYLMTVTFTAAVAAKHLDLAPAIGRVALQLALGGAMGWAFGKVSAWLLNRLRLEVEGLYPVLCIGLAGLAYTLTDHAGGNGFLAVYLVGLVLGNSDLIRKQTLVHFFDGLAWLMQAVLFLALGLLVFPSQLGEVLVPGLALSAMLVFVVRPIAVGLSLLPFRFARVERVFIAWAGLRGAVPIVFATYPLMSGLPVGRLVFNLVFFISLTSVLVQGWSMPWLAHRLGLVRPPDEGVPPEHPAFRARRHRCEIQVDARSPALGTTLLSQHLPHGLWVTLIERADGRFIVPDGRTVIEPGDCLTLTAESEVDLEVGRVRFGLPARG